MRLQSQPGFFDLETRIDKLTAMGDPLMELNRLIDWEAFRADLSRIHDKERKSLAGAPPKDVVLMFKILVLQQLHNLSDDRIEYQIRDRLSFMRFLGLRLEHKVPDAKTIWLFREKMRILNLEKVLFDRFDEQLAKRGYVARAGQMVDATFVEVPRQRNTREENAVIKLDGVPIDWGKTLNKLAQKDVDARWARKNNERHYGYKNHINADQEHKLIRDYEVTAASVHDSRVFETLLDQGFVGGVKRAVYADSAYRSKEREIRLAAEQMPSFICEKGTRGHALTDEQKKCNRIKSVVRSRVEHVFGAQAQMGGHIVRTIGIARARFKIGMMNLGYNMKRLVQLVKREGSPAPAMA